MTVEANDHVRFVRAGRRLTVHISGDLDSELAPSIGELVLAQHRPDDDEIGLDLSAVSFCDSSGLRVIFRLHGAFSGPSGGLVICNPSVAVRRILDMVDQSHVLKVRDT